MPKYLLEIDSDYDNEVMEIVLAIVFSKETNLKI